MVWSTNGAFIASTRFPPIETTPLIDALIATHAPIAIGVSGGKDSDVAAFVTQAHLKSMGHKGPCILMHSDLGRVEHKDSLPACQRLADRLGLPLVVVKRKAGDLMDRWQARWQSSIERYCALECVKVILPWSTASMRFCTSELKTAIICRDLVERYPGTTILNAAGLRRQESATRAKAQVCSPQSKLENKTFQTTGYNWLPILPWSLEQVLKYHQEVDFPLHRAYTVYKNSRVSCCYCVLGSWADLVASASNPENHEVYREQVDLEIVSSFRFQSDRWLGDVAPHLLSAAQLVGLQGAKRKARAREEIEKRIPKHLHYVKGWPTIMPTHQEAVLLSEVRRSIADLMQFSAIQYTDPESIRDRYAELMAINAARQKGALPTPTPINPIQQELWYGMTACS